jgi:hypothetical protein
MLLSGYNKFIFSIFSESKDYLILTVYALKLGKNYIGYLQIHYTRTDASGRHLPSFEFNTRLKVINSSDWDINFSEGRIIFKEDTVKIEFSFDMVLLYLNYTWDKQTSNPLKILGKVNSENNPIVWNSFDYKSSVKGNFITSNTSAEFSNAPGNIDLVKSKKIPVGINGLLWSRLQSKEIDLAYSFILNGTKKYDSRLFLLHDKKLIQFSDIDYRINKEKISPRSSVKYPNNIILTARNEEYQVSVNIHDNSEVCVNEMVNSIDFTGKCLAVLFKRLTGNPKGLKLSSKVDVILKNNLTNTEFNGIESISEYISFAR